MTMTLPVETAIFAALLGLVGAALTANAIAQRARTGITTGDGGIAALAQAIRAHGNFIEQAPLALIGLAFAEGVGVRPLALNVLGVALVASRLASAVALNGSLGLTTLRVIGGGSAVLVQAAISAAILLALFGVH